MVTKLNPKLDKWLIYGNSLVGYIYDSLHFPPGTRVKTDAIIDFHPESQIARCVDGEYKLMDPGFKEDHQNQVTSKKFLL